MVLQNAKTMGCNNIRALYNIPLKNMELIVQVLEKQIPKKPIDKSNNPHDWHVMACPCCEHTFWNSGQFVHYQPKFCNYCGQKLDWSEEE